MISWLNFAILVASMALFTIYYVRSAGPAALALRVGAVAYARCTRYRIVASVFEFLALVCYVVYVFYPLPTGLPRTFPWPLWVSVVIALVIAVPSGYLMVRGLRDAGQESLSPKPEHALHGGIYQKIRHPQAVGEMPLWWAFGFALHSPFLVLFSLVWVPIFVLLCWAEERDLVIRYGSAYGEYRARTGAVWPRRQ